MDLVLPRETNEFVPVPVYRDGVLSTSFEVALTRWPARPTDTDWLPATVINDLAGVSCAGLTHGTWQVWVRVGGTVVAAGTIWVD
jgi:hypothetical protein